MKLITEHSLAVEASSTDKGTYITGIFSSAELQNNNKRIYKKPLLERELSKLTSNIKNKCQWGELSHPENPVINPDRVAILIEKIEWNKNDVYGKAKVLDTPMGKIAKELIKEGNIGISSRGLGTVSEDGYVNEDYRLITYDLVLNPSNNPSWVRGVYEGQEFDSIDIIETVKKEYEKKIWQVLESIKKNL